MDKMVAYTDMLIQWMHDMSKKLIEVGVAA